MRLALAIGAMLLGVQPSFGQAAGDNAVSRAINTMWGRLSGTPQAAQPAARPETTRKRTRYRKARNWRSSTRTRTVVRVRKARGRSYTRRQMREEPEQPVAVESQSQAPSKASPVPYRVLRTQVIRRPTDQTIIFAGGLLALPVVESMGEPVTLEVPGLGKVDVPESEYPQLYQMLTSRDVAQQEQAYEHLRRTRDTAAGATTGSR